MNDGNFNSLYPRVGRTTCSIVFVLGIIYAITTTIGLLSLQSPDDSIGNPYFTIMEILSIVISILMAISLITVHLCAPLIDKFSPSQRSFLCASQQ